MYWVKKKRTLEELTDISNTHNEATLRSETKVAQKRDFCRNEQKMKGEAMITDNLQVKLESALQWEH